MARRSKKSEVIMAGGEVDERQRFQTRLKGQREDGIAELHKPAAESQIHAKNEEDANSAGKRLRRQPKVIDARHKDPATKVWTPDDIPGGSGEKGAEWKDGEGETRGGSEWKEPEPGAARPGAEHLPEASTHKPSEETPQTAPKAEVAAPAPKPAAMPTPKPAPKPKAKPAHAKTQKKKPPSPKHASKVVAKTMVGSMVDRMRAEAQRKGSLSVADLDAMQADFDKQAEQLGQALEKSFDNFVEAKERTEWGMKRDLPFDRVIVKSFSELFLDEDYSRFDRVSRRMLPGFFMALNMMLGEEQVEEYQEHSRLIVARLRDAQGDDFEWDTVYVEPEAKALMLDAAVIIATFFKDYDRRSQWFMELINGHLGSLEGAPKEEAGWEMTPAAFNRFLGHLFKDLRKELSTDTGKLHITKRHGADTCADIFEILQAIDS
jgi:hypothetical protein